MSARTRRFIPRLEALDDRSLPSVSVTQTESTVVVDVNDDAANKVQILDNGLLDNGIIIVVDGVSYTTTGLVTAITVNTYGGDDQVDYILGGPAFASRNIYVDLGRGDDSFNAYMSGWDLQSGAQISISAYGRGGADTFALYAEYLGTQANSQLLVDFEGGAGKDRISFDYIPGDVQDGTVTLQANLQHH